MMYVKNLSERFERGHPFTVATANSIAQIAIGAHNRESIEEEGGEGGGGKYDGGQMPQVTGQFAATAVELVQIVAASAHVASAVADATLNSAPAPAPLASQQEPSQLGGLVTPHVTGQ